MSRKDYVIIAKALASQRPALPESGERASQRFGQWHVCVLAITDTLVTDNKRFARARFLDACFA